MNSVEVSCRASWVSVTSDPAAVVGTSFEVGAETVSPRREIDRCVFAGDLDQVAELITCERALFTHTAKPRTAPWIGAVCA